MEDRQTDKQKNRQTNKRIWQAKSTIKPNEELSKVWNNVIAENLKIEELVQRKRNLPKTNSTGQNLFMNC